MSADRPGMPQGPRLVATDLDGTLLRTDGSVSERTSAVLSALDDAGVPTVLVTARPPRWLHELAHVVGPHGLAVCGNGAFVYDVVGRRVLREEGFAVAAVQDIVADLRRALPGVVLAAERGSGPWVEPDFPDPLRAAEARFVRAPLEQLDDEPVGKLLALAPWLPVAQFLELVAEVVGDRGVLAYSGAGGLAEVGPPGVSKGAGLARWCAERGIAAADVWAFGDMPNDLPMLGWAGRAYAVANAHPDVLAAADEVCPGNDEDGVAVVLERLLAGLTGC